MIIYIDIIFIINFFFDFLLLLTINIVLKRYAKIRRICLGTFSGSLSLISLFLSINHIIMFLFKIVLGILMCLLAFGYKNIRYTFYNLLYLYMSSIILGGFIYFLRIEFSYDNHGFYYQGLSIPYIFLIIIAPFILYVFIKSITVFKEIKNYYYKVRIIFDNNFSLDITGFLDTGNKLKDPITNKPIILINKKILPSNIHIHSPMLVPYHTIDKHNLLSCFKVKHIYINEQEVKNYLIGLCEESFNLNGIDCLLNYQILEDL